MLSSSAVENSEHLTDLFIYYHVLTQFINNEYLFLFPVYVGSITSWHAKCYTDNHPQD